MRRSCRTHVPCKRPLETLHARGKHGEAAQDRILRDVKGKEINLTSYEPSKVLCAFVYFFFSPSRGQIFGLSA